MVVIIDGRTKEKEISIKSQTELVQTPLAQDVQNIIEPSELGEALKHLNDDSIDLEDSRMSNIDLRSRLHHTEVSSVLALDSLVSLGVCPTLCLAFTRQKKRLAVSINGLGRKDIVDIVHGKEEREETKSGRMSFKKFFGGNSN